MKRRFALQCLAAAALGPQFAAIDGVPVRHARAGTAAVMALGAAGVSMLDHALAWGQCDWVPFESASARQPEPPQARIFLADPSEAGVCGALADSVEVATLSGLMALAVLEGPGAVVDERTSRHLQRMQRNADLVVSLPRARSSSKSVVWEGVLAPFMVDSSVCLSVDDLRDPAWRKSSATVGCGWGATPRQAMLAAMAHPALGVSDAQESGDLLVAMSVGHQQVLMRDVFEACKLLRALAPRGRLGMSFRHTPILGRQTLVHLVALQSRL